MFIMYRGAVHTRSIVYIAMQRNYQGLHTGNVLSTAWVPIAPS